MTRTMNRTITLRHLRCFAEVAESGSFTTAATRLFVTQSALTATIQQFEEAVGLKLFDRNTRRVAMTPEAVRFKAEADKILREFDAAISDLEAIAQSQKGHVRIAAAASAIYQFLVQSIVAFRAQYPAVSFTLRDAGAQQVEQLVVDGELDFAIASRYKGFDELDYVPLLSDTFGIVCRRDHPLARESGPLKWSELPAEGFVAFTQDTGIGTILRTQGPAWPGFENCQFEISSSTSLLAVLTEGGGFSIVPALAGKVAGFETLAFRELEGPVLTREVCLITRRLRSLSPTAQRLLRVLLQTIHAQRLPEGVVAAAIDAPQTV